MKKIITICLMLLGVTAQAQNFVVPTSTVEAVRRSVVKGNASNYGLAMINDTLRLVGLSSIFNMSYGDPSSIQNRTLTLTAGTGVLITGGTQNLTANRTWTISLPQSVSTSASPTFVGITLTGNQNIGGDLTVSGSGIINSVSTNSLFTQGITISNNSNSTNYTRLGFSFANTSISASDAYFDYYYKGTFGSIQTRRLFTVKLGSVTMPSDTIRINNLLALNDISDVRAAINSKLNSSTAASTYAPLASPTLVTPNLGTPSAVTLTNATGLPVSTGISGLGSGIATFLATPSSANLLAALTTKTGTGNVVFSADATLTGTTTTSVIANTAGAAFATSSGNVGIGTLSPGTTLHLFKTTTAAQSLLRLETMGTNSRPYVELKAESTDFGYFGYGSTGTDIFTFMNYRNASLAFGTNSTTRMTINSTGNLGLGTTAPAVILDINSTGAIKIPVGTTAERPASPATGMLRVNTTASPPKLEYYNGSSWIQL